MKVHFFTVTVTNVPDDVGGQGMAHDIKSILEENLNLDRRERKKVGVLWADEQRQQEKEAT